MEREHPKKGESQWYYIDPRGREPNFTLLSEMKTIDVPTKDTPNPYLQEIIEAEANDNPENFYIWKTVSDDRVRSSHSERDGEIFEWSNPPTGGHPGEDYNCRCTAEPYKPGKYKRKPKVDYSKYGKDMPKELIDAMLADKRFQREMTHVRKNEGGYNNDSVDRGLETNMGITKRWYPNEDIKNMTRERADALLYRDYWLNNGIYKLPDQIVGEVFDKAINIGQVSSIQILHQVLGITPGTIVGEKTLNELEQYPSLSEVLSEYKRGVDRRYHSIAEKDTSQQKYLKGWLRR